MRLRKKIRENLEQPVRNLDKFRWCSEYFFSSNFRIQRFTDGASYRQSSTWHPRCPGNLKTYRAFCSATDGCTSTAGPWGGETSGSRKAVPLKTLDIYQTLNHVQNMDDMQCMQGMQHMQHMYICIILVCKACKIIHIMLKIAQIMKDNMIKT